MRFAARTLQTQPPETVEDLAPFPAFRAPKSFYDTGVTDVAETQVMARMPEPTDETKYGWCPIVCQPWRQRKGKKWELTNDVIKGSGGQDDYISGKWSDGDVVVITSCTNQEYEDALENKKPRKKAVGKLFDELRDDCQVTLSTKMDKKQGYTLLAHKRDKDTKKTSPGKQLFQTIIGKEDQMPKDKFDEKSATVIAGCTDLLKKYVAKEVGEDKLKDEVMKLNPRPKAKAAARKAPAAAAAAKDKEDDDDVDDEDQMGPETSDENDDGFDDEDSMGPETSDEDSGTFDDIPLLGTGLSQHVTLPDAEVKLV